MIKQNGFALPVAVILLLVILGLGSAYFTVSRQQLFSMNRHAASERAYHIAQSALIVAQMVFDESRDFINRSDEDSWPKESKADPLLRGWIQAILNSDGHLQKSQVEFDLEHPLIDYLREQDGTDQIRVIMRMLPSQPIFSGTGFPINENEITTVVEIEAEALVGEVSSRLLANREIRYINIIPSPLSRFTLMVREFVETPMQESVNSLPMILQNGKVLACTPSHSPTEISTMLETQGWVYLGGTAEIRMGVNSGNGLISHRSPCLLEDMYLYDVDPEDSFSSRDDLMYYTRETHLSPQLQGASEQEALALVSSDDLKTGSLLLFGSEEAFSPTIVFGPVRKVSALLQGIYNTENGKYSPLPLLNPSQFLGGPWPGGFTEPTRLTIVDNFDSDFARYQIRSSKLYTTDANFLITRLLKDSEAFSIHSLEPATWPEDSNLKNLSIAGIPAPWHQAVHATAYQLKDDLGNTYFDGGDFSQLTELPWINRKSGYRFRSGADFLRLQAKNGELKLSGIADIRGDLEITDSLRVPSGQGGILIVEGNIRIRAAIEAEDSEPLTLISKTGSIEVLTSEKIEAGLVCLMGTAEFPSGFDVSGFVSAKQIQKNPLESAQPRRISYNTKMDPASSVHFRRNFRMMTERGWQLAIK
ncbi:MAG: hypothetical protein H3C47_03325 [Candidatus Cloacimonetes bacterium]|nr:hypothetical protein [Candidatus Cloacimonadota bacterium]